MLQEVNGWKSNVSYKSSDRPESRGRLRDTVSSAGLSKFEAKMDPKALLRTGFGKASGSVKAFGKESQSIK